MLSLGVSLKAISLNNNNPPDEMFPGDFNMLDVFGIVVGAVTASTVTVMFVTFPLSSPNCGYLTLLVILRLLAGFLHTVAFPSMVVVELVWTCGCYAARYALALFTYAVLS